MKLCEKIGLESPVVKYELALYEKEPENNGDINIIKAIKLQFPCFYYITFLCIFLYFTLGH